MEKPIFKNRKQKVLAIVSLCLVLTVLICTVLGIAVSFGFRMMFGSLNEHIVELNIVETPDKPANKFYYGLSIDIFEYYIFNLNEREAEPILEDIKDGNWSELNSNHLEKLEYFESFGFEYDKIFDDDYKEHECYICIYDNQGNRLITDTENQIWQDTTEWIIFLYDTEDNKYYCVFQTM